MNSALSSAAVSPMDTTYRITRLSNDGQRLIEAASRDLNAQVPACPKWTNEELLTHMSIVWTGIAAQVRQTAAARIPWKQLPKQSPQEALTQVVTTLSETDPKTQLWTWGTDHTVRFFIRRAHLETTIHRVDAEQAVEDQTPVPAADSIDGVDELFTEVLAARERILPSGTLHLHQTDGAGEFMLAAVDGSISVSHEHAKGDAAIRATAEELFLCAWGRRSLDGLQLFGDIDIAAQWMALAP
ncbi:MAG: maleylpyruvate isomerase N-terminal domain-containing protein [Acidimicrobiia bacterium]|nr:maleylpyruvate isomerase N-terminal domain-containing protein [Acidimicrobiia bacterium]MCY4458050.1 maleylpyruvate isomerase N-terminal domain-containing protein [Acidimicrobiaceae bacterium]